MRAFLTVTLSLFMAACAMAGPMELSEISLMLKHGISNAELVAEVKMHKLAVAPTDEQLAELKGFGASKELLEALAAPSNILGQRESQAFLEQKQIASEEHFWAVGSVLSVKDGVMLVLCPDVHVKRGSLLQHLGPVQIHGKLPSVFKQNEAQEVWFVNCEVRKTGVCQMKNPSNELVEVPITEVVQDFGKPQAPPTNNAPPPQADAPKRHEMVMEENTWYHMSDPKSVPGGGPDSWIRLVGSDQFHVVLQITDKGPALLAPKSEFEIKKGADGSGNNLTLVFISDRWRVFWKDSVGAFPGTGVFVFDPK